LRDAAQRLLACVRDSDTISRHGGDEFLVVLTDLQNSEVPAQIAGKIMAALGQPFHIEAHEAAISASVGIAVYPEDGAGFGELLKKADTAMYHAKESGRNAFRFYTGRMNADAQERLDLHSRLRRALERKEFVLHYQPLFDLRSGRIVGGEALVRWQSPEQGLVAPGLFIPAAEHSGLIVPLGEWVLHEACAELAHWHAQGCSQLSMAVNISAIQFRRGDVEETVRRALDASGAPAHVAGTGTHRVDPDRRCRAGAGHHPAPAGTRRAPGHRRFRHRLFEPGLPQALRRGQAEDRPVLRARHRHRPGRRRDRSRRDPDGRSLNLHVLAEGVETEAVAVELRKP
jgi:predicted signal transduction protein with EAL and GGDEF domain